jgi:hypothetical protein
MARQARGGDGTFDDLMLARNDNSHAGGPRSEDGQLRYDIVANIVLTPVCMPPCAGCGCPTLIPLLLDTAPHALPQSEIMNI